jgi:elongator complex protein 3
MKPVRTQSGVAAVAVLTQPAGCPGRCIFCPDDPTMPKSYLAREPGAQRALRHDFDPYQQTRSRLTALYNTGHPTDKVELLILGGTWGAYAHTYGEWFIQRCLDAMNGLDSATLPEAQRLNQQAPSRCVGLTIETRPDWVTPDEVIRLRRLGVTRVQLGVQSLDDRILALNGRGHDVEATRRACRLLRAAGFKLHLHWMPNLYGATPQSDQEDFARLWADPDIRPDDLKIYPTALLAGTELYELWQQGAYQPYDEAALVELLADCKTQVPPYCRLTRVVRDIPADYILEGSRASNLRETVQQRLAATGRQCRCIRCREVRSTHIPDNGLQPRSLSYAAAGGVEGVVPLLQRAEQVVERLDAARPAGGGREPVDPGVERRGVGHAERLVGPERRVHAGQPQAIASQTGDGPFRHRDDRRVGAEVRLVRGGHSVADIVLAVDVPAVKLA